MSDSKKGMRRYHEIRSNSRALIGGYKCPACKKEFHSDFCPHSWGDVALANDKWLLAFTRREIEQQP